MIWIVTFVIRHTPNENAVLLLPCFLWCRAVEVHMGQWSMLGSVQVPGCCSVQVRSGSDRESRWLILIILSAAFDQQSSGLAPGQKRCFPLFPKTQVTHFLMFCWFSVRKFVSTQTLNPAFSCVYFLSCVSADWIGAEWVCFSEVKRLTETVVCAAGCEADDVVGTWSLLSTWTWMRSTSLKIQWSVSRAETTLTEPVSSSRLSTSMTVPFLSLIHPPIHP